MSGYVYTQNALVLALITIDLDNICKQIVWTFFKAKFGSQTKFFKLASNLKIFIALPKIHFLMSFAKSVFGVEVCQK